MLSYRNTKAIEILNQIWKCCCPTLAISHCCQPGIMLTCLPCMKRFVSTWSGPTCHPGAKVLLQTVTQRSFCLSWFCLPLQRATTNLWVFLLTAASKQLSGLCTMKARHKQVVNGQLQDMWRKFWSDHSCSSIPSGPGVGHGLCFGSSYLQGSPMGRVCPGEGSTATAQGPCGHLAELAWTWAGELCRALAIGQIASPRPGWGWIGQGGR